MAQLVERLPPTPDIRSSNQVVRKFDLLSKSLIKKLSISADGDDIRIGDEIQINQNIVDNKNKN